MLKLNESDIFLNQSAENKFDAIKQVGHSLVSKGAVESFYINAMLKREAQCSTYLGKGIAIPHGTLSTRNLVNETSVVVHHYPAGVEWDNGNAVYIVIGITANSDEHLDILKQLTRVLANESIQQKIRQLNNKQNIVELFQGNNQRDILFDKSLIQRHFPSTNMVELIAAAAGLLKNNGCGDSIFTSELTSQAPSPLGKGIWLIGTNRHVIRTGFAFISSKQSFAFKGQPVKALLAFAVCHCNHKKFMDIISNLVFEKKQSLLLQASDEQMLSLFHSQGELPLEKYRYSSATFVVKSKHGLHTRPDTKLVAEARKFQSTIHVTNLNSDSKPVNAKSLIKVLSLGVKQGHHLKFIADGQDAEQAIESIGKVMISGLADRIGTP
ncbi:bifunctional PTS fructose transporter subunit IIA/HPr protein [Vibrio azureus]|uniref:Multiphosphoryl transfer protein n=1 Tax=Vibrio azureus NBRC 104587 TaxID=1219077 RepID=U3AUH9_9VIBR|nr:fused PTS fructose transporter subunit IIA/HPr protein [Vibrio azureus]AUI88036.1 bifunctional PTS fructose transporter subunit IIA/HPr protein [Vibrio azureus]GAD76897.1 fructose-specific phosphotransferase system enzyme IIA component/phosphocarrier protein HPr [Vibrio azureus NBRC 104587]